MTADPIKLDDRRASAALLATEARRTRLAARLLQADQPAQIRHRAARPLLRLDSADGAVNLEQPNDQ